MSLASPLSPTAFSRGVALMSGSSAASIAAGSAGEQTLRTITKQLKERPTTLPEKYVVCLQFLLQITYE